MGRCVWCLAVLGSYALQGCSGATPVVDLIDASGKCVTASKIQSTLGLVQDVTVVGVVGAHGTGRSTLLNKAFGTNFRIGRPLAPQSPDHPPASLAVSGNVVVLDIDGPEDKVDPAAAQAVTSAQVAALSGALSDAIVYNVWESDLGRSVPSNTRALKAVFTEKLRLLSEAKDQGEGEGSQRQAVLLVAVHDADPEADQEELRQTVDEHLESVWDEVEDGDDTPLEQLFSVQVLPLGHPKYDAEGYSKAVQTLRARVAGLGASTTAEAFAKRVGEVWSKLRAAGSSKLLPSRDELLAIYAVDTASSAAMAEVEGLLQGWRAQVGKGKPVKGFGEKAAQLHQHALKEFDQKTVSFSTSPLRASKRKELLSVLEGGVRELFERQLRMLASQTLGGYKKELLRLMQSNKLNEESEATLLRKTLYDFETQATQLAVEPMGLNIEGEYEELEADLQEHSEKFDESTGAQLVRMKRQDKMVRRPKKKRSVKNSLGVGLGLTGMIRQSGYGNLQGFGNYRAGPHSITIGYANDADAPESLQPGGKKPPLVRFQPKINLDLDL